MIIPECYCCVCIAEETPKPSRRKVDASEEYLKWKFSKVKGKKGLYFEYKPLPKENLLVMLTLSTLMFIT